MPHKLGYVLPRAIIIVFAWIVTYWILTALSTHLPPTAVYITGLAWVAAGIAGFGYLYRLRRELGTLPHLQAARGTSQSRRPAADAARALLCSACR
ncbi:MAG TPA: hypothetical protein VHY10_08300 [Xanthobacteraceae bacterium]|nr:hypothetical protein [Xanthobacteraceae bacterium]